MTHDPPRRRTGRPSLDPNEPSYPLTVSLPLSRYDALCREAQRTRVSLPELVRRALATAARNSGEEDEKR